MFGSPERSLKAFVEFSPLAVIELGLEGLVKLWNPAAERMFGWTEAEVLGRPYLGAPGEDRAEFDDGIRQLLAGCTIRGKEVRRQRKDGSPFYARLWAAPIHNQQDEITGITAIIEDISEQKESERKLRESQARQDEMEAEIQRREERMRLAFEAAKIGCWD
jgi:PAS domain S-box-containing protein